MVGYAEQAQLGSWTGHPLNKALLAQPLSHPSLMLGTQRILSQAAQAEKHHQQLLQQLLLPFVSFVLLQTGSEGSGRLTCSVTVFTSANSQLDLYEAHPIKCQLHIKGGQAPSGNVAVCKRLESGHYHCPSCCGPLLCNKSWTCAGRAPPFDRHLL